MAYIPRAQWGAGAMTRPAIGRSRRTGVAVHYGAGSTPTTAAGEMAMVRSYDAYHRSLGWGGIGYNLLVGPVTGNIYEGCGLDIQGAHAGGHNTPLIGICVVGGDANYTPKAQEGLKQAYAHVTAVFGRKLSPGVHKDYNDTSCPGPYWTAFVRGGGLTGGMIPIIDMSGASQTNPNGYSITYVKEIQQLLVARGYSVGSSGVDGILGRDTFNAVKAFQKAMGLDEDGIPGPLTRAALLRGATPIPQTGGRLDVDGILGSASVSKLQEVLGTPIDGVVDGQAEINKPYLYTWTTLKYTQKAEGSLMVQALQRKLGVGADGVLGPQTIRAWQTKLGVGVDGYCGNDTSKAIQRKLNEGEIW